MKSDKSRKLDHIFIAGMVVFLTAVQVEAHCDSMDGPVVVEAKAALAKADVSRVLKWVTPEHEQEIREAFRKTLVVRVQSSEARELADMYFFETLVRIHRAGEGAPYTGLKPAGTDPGPAVRAADQALETGDVVELAKRIAQQAEAGVRERFTRAVKAKDHADEDVKAGREFVAAYVEFVHYVERLHENIAGHGSHHATNAATNDGKLEVAYGHRHQTSDSIARWNDTDDLPDHQRPNGASNGLRRP